MKKPTKCDAIRSKIAAIWRKVYAKNRSVLTGAARKRHDKLLKAFARASCRKRS